MGKKYRNPPITEAICAFQFEPDSPWDLAVPGLIYEKIRGTFPKRRQAKVLDVGISPGPRGIRHQFRSSDRIQFSREDEKALIQVGPQNLSIHHLKPYPSWREFSPLIEMGFNAYCEVVEPKNIHRIGLRYINRIEITGEKIKLEDYFRFRPFIDLSLSQDFNAFIVGIQVPYEDSRDILKLQLTNAVVNRSDILATILDLDYFLGKPGEIPIDNIFKWVNVAHNHIEEAFEDCITDSVRQIFVEVIE